ncbi:atrial natriuretic peptide receptor-like protein [Euroglyphus maynei]|uniref:guanylate cyclase n=1 Tax=Euroglyphus maynei TaxID=6958 RepID=A0A1Y3BUK5_EURMA|nr:atrial natriuretic peptide receptor-like protein [Euroglyphus maynei]
MKLANEQQIQIRQKYYLPDQYISRHKHKIQQIIDDSYQKTRIYILLTDTFVLVDFIQLMQRKKLLDTGLYAIVSVEEEVFYSVKKGEYLNKQYKNLRNQNDHLDLRGLMIITPSPPLNTNYSEFQKDVLEYNRHDPFNIPYHKKIAIQVPIYGGLLYDAVTVIAQAFHKVIERGENLTDGIIVMDALKDLNYKSILGFNVHMDRNGDAEGNYTLLSLDIVNKSIEMQIVGSFHQTENDLPVLKLNRKLKWYGNGPILSEPLDSILNVNNLTIDLKYRHYHYEYKLTKVLWKIDLKDILFIHTDFEYGLQNIRNTINLHSLKQMEVVFNNNVQNKNEHFENSSSDIFDNQLYGVAIYKGSVAFVKRICKKSIDLTRNVRKELIQMREMRHENINQFIGAIIDAPNIAVMFIYCARGNLEDVLRNKDINLDNMFIASLVADLIKVGIFTIKDVVVMGMIYLHDSDIISHGNLKPSNCLIDSRWVLQISDYGLHEFKSNQDLFKSKENQEKGNE